MSWDSLLVKVPSLLLLIVKVLTAAKLRKGLLLLHWGYPANKFVDDAALSKATVVLTSRILL